MKKLMGCILGALLATSLCAADGEKAKKEGSVNLYANITGIEPLIDAFSKSSGLKAIYTRVSTAKYVSTVLTEHMAGKLQADLLQGPLPVLQILKEKGVIADYKSPLAAGYPEWALKEEGIVQFAIEYVAPIYNKELVKQDDIPKTYADLADKKWKDKIVMPDPASHATTISWLVGLKEAKIFASDEEWMAFLKGLAANKPMFVKSFSPTPAPVESGEKLIAISMPKYIITKPKSPLNWANVGPLLGSPRGIAVAKNAPHPEAARLMMDYWLSRDSMKMLAKEVGEYVLTPGIYPPIEGMDKAQVLPIRELSDDEIKTWGDTFKKIFYAK